MIDCPPQLGYLTMAALCAATGVLITIHPQMLDKRQLAGESSNLVGADLVARLAVLAVAMRAAERKVVFAQYFAAGEVVLDMLAGDLI
ncbi:MAG: hypothetical protein ABSC06_35920 [Rhodopila sp.]